LIGAGVAHKLIQEGHEVKMYIEKEESRDCLDNIVPKVSDWCKELNWVGKDGLIVFDEIGYGKIQDDLRKQGYQVFGGCALGDKLESNRAYGHKIFQEYGLKTVDLFDFDNIEDAVLYIKDHPKAWVVKQNGKLSKSVNYVGHFNDGKDVISLLKNYFHNSWINREKITIQERINGVEVGVGRYFNGSDWVGPIEMNIEHKKLFAGDAGPMTSEMGTLAWYDDNENNKLFQETIAKLKPFLKKINFRGDFEINCIVNETGAYPLEATSRMGSPIVNLHTELNVSPWSEFLLAIAKGQQYDLKWKKGFGIVSLVAAPPFPYSQKTNRVGESLMHGVNIYFDELDKKEMEHIHFEEVSLRTNTKESVCYIAGCQGYVLYVTSVGQTIQEARNKNLDIIRRIIIPKMSYRNDIGVKFMEHDQILLKDWGYLN
jgi:phosphoribosylamine--glycine ligase